MSLRKFILIAFVSGIPGSVLADPAGSSTPQPAAPIADRPALNSVASMPSDYTISSLDTLTVDVFGVPELSQTAVQVDNAGTIAMPFIGRVQAVGLTTSQLSQRISTELDQKYVKNPIVTVTVKDAASQKITVDGEVTQPGVYEIQPHTTLTQAVALAKGPSNVADIHEVSIVRLGTTGRNVSNYDLDAIHDGKATDPFVQANDEVVVDASGSRKFVRDFGSVLGLLTYWHP
ncbi:MAG TPA: polysaccharide biosynthesis/export family protein [Rhizomicrobium sp.]|nr:polysaccharide biosynthesis/export family protein [Rhizomicrobium sp.]